MSGRTIVILILCVWICVPGSDASADSRYSVLQKSTDAGEVYTVITLENEFLRIEMIPELGSKITSMYHKGLDWEYLDRSGKSYRGRTYDMPFSETETDGFDECFPSISRTAYPEAPWKDIVIPDHGEICMVPARFRILNLPTEKIAVVTVTNGVRFPYEFERIVCLDNESVKIEYRVTNCTAYEFPYLYAAHPLFRPVPGMIIELPPGTQVSDGKEEGWPMRWNRFTGVVEDRSVIGPPSMKQMAKLFTGKLAEGRAIAHFPDGKFIRVDFHTDELPYLGIWIDEGGLWDLYQFAFEPTTATTDDLKTAFERGQAMVIPPFGTKTWSVRYSFGRE